MSTDDRPGSVAEEIAALAEALRARSTRTGDDDPEGAGAGHEHPSIDTCEICPVCRMMTVLHSVSPAAVVALADLAHQAEVTLRTLATDLQSARTESEDPPARQDIPVDDLDGE
ncbi:MAG: hypothetical protein WCA30_15895 [Dermatophilaceae bacterium]